MLSRVVSASRTTLPALSARFFASKPVSSPNAPAAIGPYSQAVKANGFLFVSGCLGLDAKSGAFSSSDVAGQAQTALENMKAVLTAGNSSFSQVVKTTIFLTDMGDFPKVNEVYAKYFDAKAFPARSTVAVKALPKGGLVEIEAVATAN